MKCLSFGGRATLIKLVSGSISIYYMLLFKFPASVLKTLEPLRNNFFGGSDGGDRKAAWVKWEKVVASMDKGRLGIGSLRLLTMHCYKSGDNILLLMIKIFGSI